MIIDDPNDVAHQQVSFVAAVPERFVLVKQMKRPNLVRTYTYMLGTAFEVHVHEYVQLFSFVIQAPNGY